jgi:hypothetical protein
MFLFGASYRINDKWKMHGRMDYTHRHFSTGFSHKWDDNVNITAEAFFGIPEKNEEGESVNHIGFRDMPFWLRFGKDVKLGKNTNLKAWGMLNQHNELHFTVDHKLDDHWNL